MTYIAILVAAVASMALGFLWYGPLFGKVFMTETGMTKESMTPEMKRGMNKAYAINFVFEIITATVLSKLLLMLGITTVVGAWELVLLVWLGFAVSVELGNKLWMDKSWTLFFLNSSHRLVSYLIVTIVLILIK
jgi:hypothetical protein